MKSTDFIVARRDLQQCDCLTPTRFLTIRCW
jgi:hypothetical protein